MRVFPAVLLVLIISCIAHAQKMTDRDLAGLKDKVKTVQVWWQEYGADGKPVGKPKPGSKTTYDEEGQIQLKLWSDEKGEIRTTYFLYEGDRVSKVESIPERSVATTKLPPNFTIHIKKKGPYDTKYNYKYDKQGRIVEIKKRGPDSPTTDVMKYDYDRAGRLASGTNTFGQNKIVTSFKYDDAGHMIEREYKSKMHILRDLTDIPRGPIPPTIESSISRYSDYIFDSRGNWTKRTAMKVNKKGEAESITMEVRDITY